MSRRLGPLAGHQLTADGTAAAAAAAAAVAPFLHICTLRFVSVQRFFFLCVATTVLLATAPQQQQLRLLCCMRTIYIDLFGAGLYSVDGAAARSGWTSSGGGDSKVLLTRRPLYTQTADVPQSGSLPPLSVHPSSQ